MKNRNLNTCSMLALVSTNADKAAINSVSYLMGAIIALLILGYLVYTLIKPEKF